MDPLPTASTTSQSQTFANREVFRFGLSPAGPPDSPFLDYEDMGAPLTVPGVDFGYRYFAGEVVPTSILGAAASVSPSPTLYAVGPNHHTGAATAEIVLLEIDGATPAAIAEYDLVYDSAATDENGLAFTGEPDFADFAYNPLDGNLYGYDTRTKRFAIIRFDDVNEVFEVFPFDALNTSVHEQADGDHLSIGAFYYDGNGEFLAVGKPIGTGSSVPNHQNTIYRVHIPLTFPAPSGGWTVADLQAVETTLEWMGELDEPATEVDGTECPYAPIFWKEAEAPSCPVEFLTYTFTIINNDIDPLTVDLGDTLPPDYAFVLGSISYSSGLASGPISTSGGQTLDLDGLTVAPLSSLVITIEATLPDDIETCDLITNQAMLTGLPPYFGSDIEEDIAGNEMLSDDPNVNGFVDPTVVSVPCCCEICELEGMQIEKSLPESCEAVGTCIATYTITNPLGNADYNGPLSIQDVVGNSAVGLGAVSPAPWTCTATTAVPDTRLTCGNPSVSLPGDGSTEQFTVEFTLPADFEGETFGDCVALYQGLKAVPAASRSRSPTRARHLLTAAC